MSDDHRDGCMCHGCVCSRYELEIHSLTNDIEHERADADALDCENKRFAEAHVEIKQLRDALVTIGDASARISAMELQVFARNVLKGIEK